MPFRASEPLHLGQISPPDSTAIDEVRSHSDPTAERVRDTLQEGWPVEVLVREWIVEEGVGGR